MQKNLEIQQVLEKFSIKGNFFCKEIKSGHINNTYLIEANCKKYILQKVNTLVFTNPEAVMSNIKKVTAHLKKKNIPTLDFLSTTDGKNYYVIDNSFYRIYSYLEGEILDKPNKENMQKCGEAFGIFQNALADFPAEELLPTIKDFHNTKWRYQNLENAIQKDVCNRKKECISLLKQVEDYKQIAFYFDNCKLPLRVTHNDTKTNNVLLLPNNKSAILDLDTVMPGYVAHDFGDALRFGANTAEENEPNLSKVDFDLSIFECFSKGFLSQVTNLTPAEIISLPYGAISMTFECGIRFLTDFLEGDVYFKTDYPTENLDRASNQLYLCAKMVAHLDEMKEIVAKLV